MNNVLNIVQAGYTNSALTYCTEDCSSRVYNTVR